MKNLHNKIQKNKSNFTLKGFTVFFLAVFVFASCSKDDDDVATTPTPEAQKFRIKEIIRAGSYTDFYTYNNRNQVVKQTYSTSNFSQNYEYDSNGFLIRSEGKDAPAGQSSQNEVFTYTNDSQGKILEYIRTASPTNKTKYTNTYTNGFLTESTTYNFTNTGNGWTPTYRNEYTNNAAGKAISTVTRQYNPVTSTWTLFSTGSSTYTSANLAASNITVSADGREFKAFYEYDVVGGLTKFTGYSKANPNAEFVKYNETDYTKDNVKPTKQDYMNDVVYNNPNYLVAFYLNKKVKRYALDVFTGTVTNEENNFTHEYNKDGYVTKTFKNGTLEATYVLELVN